MPKAKSSGYGPVADNWFVEPGWAVDLLLTKEAFRGAIHDPCCGEGTIPDALYRAGIECSGSDTRFRGWPGQLGLCDFIKTPPHLMPGLPGGSGRGAAAWYQNIVFNPPYGRGHPKCEAFIRKAIEITTRKVCAFVRLDFLASIERYRLFIGVPPTRIWIMSTRPSCPPGGRGIKPKGGQHDYCWIVWDQEVTGSPVPTIGWLLRREKKT